MRQHSNLAKDPAEKVVKDIRRATRKQYSAEEKIRIVLEGLRGEDSIAELCRREGIAQNLYYRWSKDFLEAAARAVQGGSLRLPRIVLREFWQSGHATRAVADAAAYRRQKSCTSACLNR